MKLKDIFQSQELCRDIKSRLSEHIQTQEQELIESAVRQNELDQYSLATIQQQKASTQSPKVDVRSMIENSTRFESGQKLN